MDVVKEVPVIGVSVNEQIGHRSVVLQTHIASDCTTEELNALMDRLLAAADRQKLYYETKEERFKLQLNLDNHELQLETMQADIVRVEKEMKARWDDSGRKGDYKPSANERAQRLNLEKNVEAFGVNIARLKTAIAECDAILAKSGKE